MILPVDAAYFAVERLFIGGVKGGKRAQQAHAQAAPQGHFVEQAVVADELNGAGAHVRDVGAEGIEFVGEQFFQAELGGGGEVHIVARIFSLLLQRSGMARGHEQLPAHTTLWPCFPTLPCAGSCDWSSSGGIHHSNSN